jgi:hypothetical protein
MTSIDEQIISARTVYEFTKIEFLAMVSKRWDYLEEQGYFVKHFDESRRSNICGNDEMTKRIAMG